MVFTIGLALQHDGGPFGLSKNIHQHAGASRGLHLCFFVSFFWFKIVSQFVGRKTERTLKMIISIRSQASSEERAQLLALLGRVTRRQQPIMPITIDGREIIALDGSQLDAQASKLLSQQGAVERIVPVKTPYKLVSRNFKPEGSSILVGAHSAGKALTIGRDAHRITTPVIIAGPCAV